MRENRKKRMPRKVSVFLSVLMAKCSEDVFPKSLMLILEGLSMGTSRI
jgi:hypothetical protein